MRIAMLYTPLITAGGAERQALQELKLLRTRGHRVQLLTFRLEDHAMFVDGVSADDVTVLRRSRGGWPRQILALHAALRRMRPDLLVSHTSPELAWLATRFSGVPYVQYHNSPPFYIGAHANPYMASRRYRRVFEAVRRDVAGYAEFEEMAAMPLHRRLLAEARTMLKHGALRAARAVVVPSERTVRELRLLHGVEATVVRGCLPASLLEGGLRVASMRERLAPGDEPVILSVCRLEPQKRVDLLLRAFAIVRQSIRDARLVIAGKGSELARLRVLARDLDVAEAVTFAGFVPEDELWGYYAAADVLAAPAMADFNIAPYEAMALGCKAVWTTEMETDAAIGASGQVFVAAPEPEAFARAIVEALHAPAARADLRGMTWDARVERVERVYGAAAAAPREGQRAA